MFTTGTHKTLARSLETIGAAFAIIEIQGGSGRPVLVTANSLFEGVTARPIAECIERPIAEIFPRYLEKPLADCLNRCLLEQSPQESELVVERSGTSRWWRLVASPVLPARHGTQRVIATLIEITEKKRLEQQLEISRQRFAAVVETSYDGVIIIDENQTIKQMNASARHIFGAADDNGVVGTNLSRFIPLRFRARHPDYIAAFRSGSVDARPMESRSPVRGLRADGSEFPLEVTISKIRVGNDIEMTAVLRDVSERVRLIDELSRAATHDGLTGIYNRRIGEHTLQNEFQRCQRFSHDMSVAMIDIDHFKNINDTYGHACGDRVLQSFVATLSATLREIDVFCRWGGEEFLVILPETGVTAAEEWAERARAALNATTLMEAALGETAHTADGDEAVTVTASFGLASLASGDAGPDGKVTAESIVRRADAAMYRAKKQGRNQVATA